MEYDLVKDRLGSLLSDSVALHRLFFAALDRLFLRARYVQRELLHLKSSGFAPQRILDAGSGFGQYSFLMARTFPQAEIYGLDLKTNYVARGNRLAQKMGQERVRFSVGDLLTFDTEAQYDLALSVDVLEHIEDDQSVINNIGRALKPGGRFILTTPYWDGVNESPALFVDEHVRPGYGREELRQKLAFAGLELAVFTITYGPWGNIAWNLLQKLPMKLLAGKPYLLPLVALYFIPAYPLAWLCMKLDMQRKNIAGGGILAVARKL